VSFDTTFEVFYCTEHIFHYCMYILQDLPNTAKRLASFLLLIVGLLYTADGMELEFHGLNIEQIRSFSEVGQPGEIDRDVTALPDAKYLDDILRGYTFPTTVITEKVLANVKSQGEQKEQAKNLPDASINKIHLENEDIQEKIPWQSARSTEMESDSKPSTNNGNRLLKKEEIINQGQTVAEITTEQITKNLCHKLAKDAFRIANAHKNRITREATTCLCVVLRNACKHPKKFVFHNHKGELPKSMREEADRLCYSIENIHRAHAEVQCINFLIAHYEKIIRASELPGATANKYTHILGMGCSRKHCQECDALLKLFLGKGYFIFTAATEQVQVNKSSMPTIEELTQEQEGDLKMQAPAEVFKVVLEREAVRENNTKKSDKYHLSEYMRRVIKLKSGLKSLNFSDARFGEMDSIPQVGKNEATGITEVREQGKKEKRQRL